MSICYDIISDKSTLKTILNPPSPGFGEASQGGEVKSSEFIDLSRISVTDHALDQYQDRWPFAEEPKNWLKEMRRCLSKLKRVYRAGRVRRKKSYYFACQCHSEYFIFVVDQKMEVVITVMDRRLEPHAWVDLNCPELKP